jgi:hypothetical protein
MGKNKTIAILVEQLEHLYTDSENVKWCSHCGKWCDYSPKIKKKNNFYMIQQFYFWVCTLRELKTGLQSDIHYSFVAITQSS